MLYLEAEELDGTTYRWVIDSDRVADDVLEKISEVAGQPDTIVL